MAASNVDVLNSLSFSHYANVLELTAWTMCFALLVYNLLGAKKSKTTSKSELRYREEENVKATIEAAIKSGAAYLDLSNYSFVVLPPDLATLSDSLTSIKLSVGSAKVDLALLPTLRKVHTVEIVGAGDRGTTAYSSVPIASQWLHDLTALADLDSLDISTCRIKDTNNSAKNLSSAIDLFKFQDRLGLSTIKIPALAAVEIGTVAKVFPKVNVVVVELIHPLRLGDVVQFRRVQHNFSGSSSLTSNTSEHEWRSKMTNVKSIRTDSHEQLMRAVPKPGTFENFQFAIPVTEVGKKGDSVYWIGRELAK